MDSSKDAAIQKIMNMSQEQASKMLIFIAGMEAERHIRKRAIALRKNKQEANKEDSPCQPDHKD